MPINIVMPQAGESVTSGVVLRWLKQVGEAVKRDEDVVEIETDKVTLGVPSPAAGVLASQAVREGDKINVGGVLGAVDEKATAAAPAAQPAAAPAAKAETPASKPEVAAPVRAPEVPVPVAASVNGHAGDDEHRATPLARKLAEEHGIDLNRIAGTGAGNRVREQDVLAAVQARAAGGSAPAQSPAPRAASGATIERLSPLRQRIAQRLVQAQHTAAMLTTFNEVDMSAVMALRKKYKDDFEKKHSVGLGFMSFFVKAAVSALKAFPMVNGYIVEQDGELALEKHSTHDIAIAVSTPKGLVVPVIRRCEELSFAQIEAKIGEIAGRARDGKLTLEDMQGGTFTITNGGIFGSLMSTPILNAPQSAILGMHVIKNRAVEDPDNPGQIVLRPMMYLAMSYDHRLIDGQESVRFLMRIKQCIEDPARLLIEV